MALFQHNTLGAIMAGNYDGTISVKELLKKGNIGIGTYDKIDGELIILDGKAYRADSEGNVEKANPTDTLPYASIADCKNAVEIEITKKMNREELSTLIKSKLYSLNLFTMLQIDGIFESVRTRAVAAQEKPYKSFKKAVEEQVIFEKEILEGSIVGLYTPKLFGMISAQGFHTHIINNKRNFGGHLLSFTIRKGTVKLYTQNSLEQSFPVNNNDFINNEIETENILEDIADTEK